MRVSSVRCLWKLAHTFKQTPRWFFNQSRARPSSSILGSSDRWIHQFTNSSIRLLIDALIQVSVHTRELASHDGSSPGCRMKQSQSTFRSSCSFSCRRRRRRIWLTRSCVILAFVSWSIDFNYGLSRSQHLEYAIRIGASELEHPDMGRYIISILMCVCLDWIFRADMEMS